MDSHVIAAVATPPGRGGVGIIRLSGPDLSGYLRDLHPSAISPRVATYAAIQDKQGTLLDQCLLLFFPAPNSFTGEDVIEIHGHGGPVVMDMLLDHCLSLGARLAQPGEFSQRAFLNDKIDLAQAEAIADLIDASSRQAAQGAVRSLQGKFSDYVNRLVEGLIDLRTYVEAAIDFPDEEIDFLADGHVLKALDGLLEDLEQVIAQAGQGSILRDGMSVVIAGKPNAGKSSLLNALAGRDAAIVTDIAGTTRDVLKESIHIEGMPLHIIDTAGLRESEDLVEQEGVRRAWEQIEQADRILWVIDVARDKPQPLQKIWPNFFTHLTSTKNITLVCNKMDLSDSADPFIAQNPDYQVVKLSAKTGSGVDGLRQHLKTCMGYQGAGEGTFVARRRHLEALHGAKNSLLQARQQLVNRGAGELVAEDLRYAQQQLGSITGEFTSDDLLGKIFSSFCIGK